MADEKTSENDTRIEPTLDMESRRNGESMDANDMANALEAEFAASEGNPVEDELRAEVASLKDQVLRTLAETENVRRRAERDKADTAKYAIANFAKAVLSVADNMERALASVSAEARAADEALENLCVGLELTQTELHNANERFGIERVEAMGKKLDPNFHQAMFEVEDASVPAGTVVQVMQHGYTIHDRLLRPAMVGVAKGGPKDGEKSRAPGAEPGAANENPAAADASQAYAKRAEAGEPPAEPAKPKLDTEL